MCLIKNKIERYYKHIQNFRLQNLVNGASSECPIVTNTVSTNGDGKCFLEKCIVVAQA